MRLRTPSCLRTRRGAYLATSVWKSKVPFRYRCQIDARWTQSANDSLLVDMERHGWNWPSALGLGIFGLVLAWYPVVGVPASAVAVFLGVRAVRRSPQDNHVILVLCFDTIALSINAAALIWSVFIAGLYGIAVAP